MDVKSLGRRITGYTAKVPGAKASKARLRRALLAMVRQLEIETTETSKDAASARNMRGEKMGDVPCLFGTLTTQRYQWDQLIQTIAAVERQKDPEFPLVASLSNGKRRELVNKYPLIVAWYCALRLELVLKTVVVPIFKASAYGAVYEWSPTGGMLHLHYIIWKRGSPRFDQRADDLVAKAKLLQRAGLVAAAEVRCDIADVVDYYSEYINEWNPNKNEAGETQAGVGRPLSEQANEEHPAALDVKSLLNLLQTHNADARFKY